MPTTFSRRQVIGGIGAGLGAVAIGTRFAGSAHAQPAASAGEVYTLTNSTGGNAVAVYRRAPNGPLTPGGTVATGGTGTGAGLGNQGAVTLSDDGRWLLGVNAGDNSLSAFRVQGGALTLTGTVHSGGIQPISVTVSRDLVYVLNDGGTATISGFRLDSQGRLTPLIHSTRLLSSSTPDAAQVQFSPSGRLLVVTEKATNRIAVYPINGDGLASDPVVQPSAGPTPFGCVFLPNSDRLLVSEAFGGMPNAGAVSSYEVAASGGFRVLDGPVATRQTAACWVAVTPNGRYAYATNTGSGTITGFAVGNDARLTRLNENGVTAGEMGRAPLDAAIDRSGRFLYVLNSGTDRINGYTIGSDGSLTSIPGPMPVPDGATGIAVR